MAPILTYKFRIKGRSAEKRLERMARAVNFVWNYCNETSAKAWSRDRKWLGWPEMCRLTAGGSKELCLHSHTIAAVAQEHALGREQSRRAKLRWRSTNRSLGWIPFKAECVKTAGDTVIYFTQRFRFWKSRELPARVRAGCFVQDARRRWYVCFQCEAPAVAIEQSMRPAVGIDLGLKQQVTCSTGEVYARDNLTRKYEGKLAKAQRAKKRRQAANIHARVANARKDWAHKVSTKIVKTHSLVVVGGVSAASMAKRGGGFAKSALDAGWSQFRVMLAYKARRLGVAFREVNEAWSTCTCSVCSARAGPSGLGQLGVREWVCTGCGTPHRRDVNAARNILALGLGH
jgi:putative transposase